MFYPGLRRSGTHVPSIAFLYVVPIGSFDTWSIETFSKSDHIDRNDPSSYKLSDWFEVSYDLVCH